ncbi:MULTISPECIES: HAD family hydrolase [Breznakia]|uniref:Cof subfamily protein (Haloacid dehalogenase superfamily)/HAD superfamily hydrolase (TIGR01484 family) n=1 Tax=Breznakia blatticola TaxID=1754012 RepID=A0A4R8A6H8_9FIRM|nr:MULTISPECIES: HAD family hydrolase [Breznakia]MDH6367930.1 Cof subfamily protein (haloacid dehalogenase superfamily) [Breznakia sp. PH1-1]MDH6405007.1 Cof subfamily protein (haloacid dehalogenase superfamily) [Breznakia sp. PF1-11]MDH6412733.1 Cof subfamily protein (haloacid dehalogenase superfamily) [Breznakia sp. PFB1-11]MDH6415082.1 Cof subfamily protein (haloacid dehalogenase superfamily) [Breznakia sp. PFB1-14]MDH6417404.1 Cof subfamily protein (haloacid dehalogenase superfamily) [Brez
MYKLICVDLDGTLLNSRNMITPQNKKAIRKALDAGIEVAIVSGRPNCFTIRIMNQISVKMSHITFNGGYYRVAGKSRTFPIPASAADQIAHLAQKYNVRTYFKNKNLSLCTRTDPGVLDYDLYKDVTPEKDRMDMYYSVDTQTILDHDTEYLKIISLQDDVDSLNQMVDEVEKIEGIRLYRYPDYFECSSIETSKGLAIKAVCKDIGIDLSDVVCIGDNFNDLPMFEVAGLSVAMKNAPDAVKEKVDVVTLSNDDSGVAYAIENYVLKEQE